MKLSLCLSMAAGLAATVGSAQAQQTTYFNSGRPDTLLNAGAVNFVGFISGNNTGTPQRWSAQAFTIGAGGADIGEIDAEGFITPGNDPASIAYIIWNRAS